MVVLCRRCGNPLTSPRSIEKGIGQRCLRAEQGRPWPLNPKETPLEGVEYIESGGDTYRRRRIFDRAYSGGYGNRD